MYFNISFAFNALKDQNKIQKILIPTDFSENSLNACRYAFIFAKNYPADLILFHAHYSPALDLIDLTEGKNIRKKLSDEVNSNLTNEAESDMQAFKLNILKLQEAEGFSENNIKTIIKLGSVKEEILSITHEINPDLIIMGTHGKNNAVTSFLGSVTEFVIDKLGFPVMAIPVTSVSKLNEMKSILYLTDFNEADFQSIKKIIELTDNLNIHIHCMHVGGGNDERKKVKMEGLIEYFNKAYNYSAISFKLLSVDEKKNVLPAIENYSYENEISIISVTYRQRNILEKYLKPDLTKRIFHRMEIPLLIFHS